MPNSAECKVSGGAIRDAAMRYCVGRSLAENLQGLERMGSDDLKALRVTEKPERKTVAFVRKTVIARRELRGWPY